MRMSKEERRERRRQKKIEWRAEIDRLYRRQGERMIRNLISIKDAEAQGVERLRKPNWSNPFDHLHIKPHGVPGIWTHLYCPFNKECNGRDPVEILKFELDLTVKVYEPYTGALPDSDEYKAAVAFYDKRPAPDGDNQR